MKRYRGLVGAAIAVVAVVFLVRLGRPGPPPPPSREADEVEEVVNFVEPAVTEFTPAGWERFRAGVAAAVGRLPPSSSYHDKDPALELFARQAVARGKAVEAYRAVEPGERRDLFRRLAAR